MQGALYAYTFTAQVEVVALELIEYFEELPEEPYKLLRELIIIGNICVSLSKTSLSEMSDYVSLMTIGSLLQLVVRPRGH